MKTFRRTGITIRVPGRKHGLLEVRLGALVARVEHPDDDGDGGGGSHLSYLLVLGPEVLPLLVRHVCEDVMYCQTVRRH